jgi:ABC-2 type transport system permease protein
VTPGRPGTLRSLVPVSRLALRRLLNRLFAGRQQAATDGRTAAAGAESRRAQRRSATPGKRYGVGAPAMVLLSLVWLINGVQLVTRSVDQLAIASDGRIVVSRETYRRLGLNNLLEPGSGRPRTMAPDATPGAQGERHRQPDLERVVAHDARRRALLDELIAREVPAAKRDDLLTAWEERYAVRGLDAFTVARNHMVPGAELWPQAQGEGVFVARLAVLVLALGAALLCFGLGSANRDLGALEWSMEWLYTFPVSARALFLARLTEYTVLNAFGLLLIFPLFLVALCCAGLGWWSLPLALAATLHLSALIAALRLALETILRLHLPAGRRKNLQAGLTLAFLVLFYLVMWIVLQQPAWFLDATAGLGKATAWWPGAQPLLMLRSPWYLAGPLLVLTPLLAGWGAIMLCERLVARGLVAAPGAYHGRRRGLVLSWPRRLVSGILAKDLLLLARDRNVLVQTLVAPVLVVAFQLLINQRMLSEVVGNPRNAAMFAFAIGSYVLMASAFGVLAVEGPALWLLYALPHRLHRLLVAKATLWAACACGYAAVVLIACAACSAAPASDFIPVALLALAGVALYAFIAASFGVFAYRPQSIDHVQSQHRDPLLSYLYVLLAGCFAWAVYNESWWGRFAQLALTLLLVYALWQKVADRLPYLLDPVSSPPPSLSLSDGLIAVLAFSVIQSLLALPLGEVDWPPALRLFAAYALSAMVVALCCQYSFARAKVPDLWRAVGLRALPGAPGPARALILGTIAGLAAATAAVLYLAYVQGTPAFQAAREAQGLEDAGGGISPWMVALLVLAAPLAEEYLFRGLVYRGLRRSWGVAPSVLASAGVFAIVHPPLSVVPVFVLGAAAAISFEYSGMLLAPITAHALYNLSRVLLDRLI